MNVDLTRGESGLILSTCAAEGLTPTQTAYVMATAAWETAQSLTPVREAYYLGNGAEAYRARLRYAPWYGRGFVQLTWQENYARAGKALGVDLLAEPDLALDPGVAVQVLVKGMMGGWFSGKALPAYVNAAGVDYAAARRVVNGRDCATEIAALADLYECALLPVPDEPVLRRGDSGRPVARMQACLTAAGCPTGIDGVFGRGTENALRSFQRAGGLTEDGVAGARSWARLILYDGGETESGGDIGEEVSS